MKTNKIDLLHGITRIVLALGLTTWFLISLEEEATTIFLIDFFVLYASMGGIQLGSFFTRKEYEKETRS